VTTTNTDPLGRFRLDDKVVVVTGASSGLGESAAREFAAVGAHLVLAARRIDRLQQLADELQGAGTQVLVTACDVVSPEDCAATADAAAGRFGRIDVLVNNAGVGPAGAALREDPSVFRSTIDVNLIGAYLMARACAPHMPAGSAIVNVSSVLGLVASRFPQAGYAASKAGLLGLTRDLAQQWTGRRGIRVNALCPGYFDSDITSGEGSDKLQEMVEAHSIVGRFATQEELTAALLFLAAPASSYMTGASLVVDGGLSATL
jgi:NAD(P)-dependent dehydrogenase (short-subunit alcohol dehydrogenase family)